jgi:hypothetical protein
MPSEQNSPVREAKGNGSDVWLRGLSELQINCCFPCVPNLSRQAEACSD